MKIRTSLNAIRLTAGSMLALSSLMANAQQQQVPDFRWKEHFARPGDTLHASYKPHVPDSVPVKGFVYFYQNYKWYGHKASLTKTDTGYLVQQVIPQGTAMVAYRFYLGDTVDRGGRWPYTMVLHKDEHSLMPGALTEYALMRRRNIMGSFSPLVMPQSEIESKVAVLLYIAKEWGNMEVRRNRFFDMAVAIKDYMPPAKADSVLRRGAAEIGALSNVSEKDMLQVRAVFNSVLYNRKAADSVQQIILSQYPQGQLFRMNELAKLARMMDRDTLVAAWNNFLKKYPFDKYPVDDYLDPVTGEPNLCTKAFMNMGGAAFKVKDWNTLMKMAPQVPNMLLSYFYSHFINYPFRQVNNTFISEKEAYELAKVYMPETMRRIYSKDIAVSGRGLYAEEEWPAVYLSRNSEDVVHYTKLSWQNGNYAEAFKYAQMIQPVIKYSDVPFNDIYVKLLVKFNQQKQALAYVRSALYMNSVTPEMINLLKADYVKQNGSDKNFPAYIVSLKSKAIIEKEHAEIRKSMVSVPCPDVELMDTKGNKVSLASQKGKVLVLDFWATWCYYCKLAMPGMKMAMEHYTPKDNVSFYYIATLERDPRFKQQIDSFITAKKYPFTVLYDEKRTEDGEMDKVFSAFSKLFHFQGIPQKVIIDQHGMIRWTGSGGTANHIALAEEITYIVDLLKKEGSASVAAAGH